MKNNTIKRLTAVTVIMGIVNLIIAALFVLRLPDTVPTHFDASFVCNGTGSRWLGIMLPIVVLAIFPLGLLITSKSKNIEKNIKPLTIILLFIEVMLIAVSWFILIVMDSGAQLGDKIPANFDVLLPFIIGLMFVVMGNYLPTVRQNKNLGIKLPWTLKKRALLGCHTQIRRQGLGCGGTAHARGNCRTVAHRHRQRYSLHYPYYCTYDLRYSDTHCLRISAQERLKSCIMPA